MTLPRPRRRRARVGRGLARRGGTTSSAPRRARRRPAVGRRPERSQAALATCALLERVAAADDWRAAAVLLRRLRRVGGGVVRAAPGRAERRQRAGARCSSCAGVRAQPAREHVHQRRRGPPRVWAASSRRGARRTRSRTATTGATSSWRRSATTSSTSCATSPTRSRTRAGGRGARAGLVAPGAVVLTARRSRSVAAFLRRRAGGGRRRRRGAAPRGWPRRCRGRRVTRVTAAAAMAVAGRCRCAVVGCSRRWPAASSRNPARASWRSRAALRKPVLALCALYRLRAPAPPGAAAARGAPSPRTSRSRPRCPSARCPATPAPTRRGAGAGRAAPPRRRRAAGPRRPADERRRARAVVRAAPAGGDVRARGPRPAPRRALSVPCSIRVLGRCPGLVPEGGPRLAFIIGLRCH